MRTSARLLQTACRRTLAEIAPQIDLLRGRLDAFKSKYEILEFSLSPFKLHGKKVDSRELFREHHKDVLEIARLVRRDTSMARLACVTVPAFIERAGDDEAKALDLLAAETASLVIARSMMLRFLEDHGFFGKKRYLCNGGIKAFQQMRDYYGTSYARMLRDTYGEGSKIYSAIFCENELDWVLGSENPVLSIAIERSLFYLSHFDFATIDQDVLSNIYGQFLDTSQRKSLGEHYTPPDISVSVWDLGMFPPYLPFSRNLRSVTRFLR